MTEMERKNDVPPHQPALTVTYACKLLALAGLGSIIGAAGHFFTDPRKADEIWNTLGMPKTSPELEGSWKEPLQGLRAFKHERAVWDAILKTHHALDTRDGMDGPTLQLIGDLKRLIRDEVVIRRDAEKNGLSGYGAKKDRSDTRFRCAKAVVDAAGTLIWLKESTHFSVSREGWQEARAKFLSALESYRDAAITHLRDYPKEAFLK